MREIAASYALGIVDAEDRDLPQANADPELRAEIEAFQNAAGAMAALTAVEPPAGLQGRVMAGIGAAPASGRRAQLPQGVLSIVRSTEGKWIPTPFPGISMKQLFYDPQTGNESVLVRMRPGSTYPNHRHMGLEHALVLEGDAVFSDHTLTAGDDEVGEAGRDHSSITTQHGCLVFLIHNRADILYAN